MGRVGVKVGPLLHTEVNFGWAKPKRGGVAFHAELIGSEDSTAEFLFPNS